MHVKPWPEIRKAKRVVGKTLVFRDAIVDDAAFIYSLRTDVEKSRFLSAVPNDIDAQRLWLSEYSKCNGQAYFIIEYQDQKIGTVRLYDAKENSFCWGSWILISSRPSHAAMEAALMVYTYAIDHLGFSATHFDVRKGNERVWKFHERFGAKRIAETELDFLYTIDLNNLLEARKQYSNFLSGDVSVVF